MRELEATWAFESALQDRCAERLEPFEWGTALFRLDMPRVHDQNLLRMESGFDTASARGLASEADRLQRPAGLSHRKLLVPDERAGERLAPGFAELSWRRARHVVMAHRGSAPADATHAVEVPPTSLRDARIKAFEGELGEGASAQVAAALDLLAAVAASARGFAVSQGSEVASWCVLYEEDGIGQVDDVVTAEPYRRRGYARAVVSAATRASLESGNEITFLVADDEDWPKDLYTRLGYEAIGRRFEFTRM